jgi:hypothetical protein
VTRADIVLAIVAAVFAGSTLAVSTWHSARTLDVICTRGLR